ncbi:MAG: hypothetical protein JXR52_08280 [Bacteroidales bacterium]|nr:hypothetical protein [Bacteroidales bacterium]MBN2698808.1 hypothetical protein [Bacteroidales bacterium]
MRTAVIILWLIGTLTVKAGDFRLEIYQAYISSDMDRWASAIRSMEREWERSGDHLLLYDLTEAQYGYIAWCISVKKRAEAEQYLRKAEANIETLLAHDPDLSKVYALKGALYGFRVGLEPLKAPFYGRKSVDWNGRAIELDPQDPQGWMERANIEFYKPAVFGGSKQRAVPLYEKAVGLYEANRASTEKSWIYLNCLSALANAYAETGSIRKADSLYRRILGIEPDFKWIKEEVYPEFRKNHPGV